MTSEIENIIKGKIESTVDFATGKKTIGVSNSNLTPDVNGIVPLGKQGAFIEEKVEQAEDFIETFDTAINTAIPGASEEAEDNIEAVDLPTIDDNKLSEPSESDVTLENPVQVDGLQSLNTMIPPHMEDNKEENNIKEEKPMEVEPLDFQLPQMPEEVLAEVPAGLDDSLFVDSLDTNQVSKEVISEPVPEKENGPIGPETLPEEEIIENNDTIEQLPQIDLLNISTMKPVEEEKSEEMPELPSNSVEEQPAIPVPEVIDLDTLLAEKRKALINRINELTEAELIKYSEEIKNIIANSKAQTQGEQKQVEDNPLMSDALNQINNMVIPEEPPRSM